MEFRQIFIISLEIISVCTKKYHQSSSDESIENLLYFKDCQRAKNDAAAEVSTSPPFEKLVAPSSRPQAMDCPFPKMCCSLTCGGNECGASSSFSGSQIETMDRYRADPNYLPIKSAPGHPQTIQQRRKKKMKQPSRMLMQPPIGGRRNFGFTKERIKSLINQDDDIRKILKDLVRVTMKKVDLVDMINTNNKAAVTKPSTNMRLASTNTDDEDYEDLE